jgi:hypothetical protein
MRCSERSKVEVKIMKDEVKAKLAAVYPPRRTSSGSTFSRSADRGQLMKKDQR